MVGDVVDVHQGDRVPADCILVEEMNITVDQSMYYPGQTNVEKEQSSYYGPNSPTGYPDNHHDHPDPFLLVDSKIMTGSGKAIICAVGQNTLLARNRSQDSLVLEEQTTHLETKLELTANQIGKFAVLATVLSVVTHLIFLILYIMINED